MQYIFLEEFFQEGKLYGKLFCPNNAVIIKRIQVIKGIEWSKSWHAWYFPCEDGYKTNLKRIIGKEYCLVLLRNLGVRINLPHPYREEALKLLRTFVLKLTRRNYTLRTIRLYTDHIRHMLEFHTNVHPFQLNEYIIDAYYRQQIARQHKSAAFVNQFVNAARLFGKEVLNILFSEEMLNRPTNGCRSSEYLSVDEVQKIFTNTVNIRHKTIFGLLYAAGLKPGEALRIRVRDLDIHRKMLQVRNESGQVYRNVILADNLVPVLKRYFSLYRPRIYLFENHKGTMIVPESIQAAFRRILSISGITKNATLQTFRKSLAAHLLLQGVPPRIVKEMTGYKHLKFCNKITAAPEPLSYQLANPFDRINVF